MIDTELEVTSTLWELVSYYVKPISQYLEDPAVTSICVNHYDTIFIRKNGVFERTPATFKSEALLTSCISQIASALSQEANQETKQILDARLADGSRINAVLYPSAYRGANMTIRLFPKVRFTVDDLLSRGAFDEDMLEFLQLAIVAQYNMLISGASGGGKTTILNALANLIPAHIRTGVFEDTAELDIALPNIVYAEAPRRFLQSPDPVTLERLLINALRQELETIVVGEVRAPQAATALLLALNAGHRGVLSTLHANDAKRALRRLEIMLLSNDTRVPYEAVHAEMMENFDLIIQAERTPQHGQRIVQIAELDAGQLKPLWAWDYKSAKHVRLVEFSKTRLHEAIERYR